LASADIGGNTNAVLDALDARMLCERKRAEVAGGVMGGLGWASALDFLDFFWDFCREEVDVMTVEEMEGRDLLWNIL